MVTSMKIIAVASAKGGVGKSTFCCGIAGHLVNKKKRILLIDADIGVRSLDILLGVSEKTVYNWGDVIVGNCEYRKAVTEVRNELFLLPAPINFSDSYTTESFGKMIEALKNDFDYVILDAPAGLESGFVLASSVADECIIISTPEPTSIRAASYACERVKKNTNAEVRLVINKFNKVLHKKIDIDEVIDTVSARLLGIIPDSREIYASVNGKKLPADCKGNKALRRIADRIDGENIPLRIKEL